MLTRRELLARGSTVLLLVPIIGCSTSPAPTTTPVGSGSGPSCAGTDILSTVDEAHTHTLCVLTSDLTRPPSGGVTYTTSNDGGHTHMVVLAQSDLIAINAGQTVTVASTNDVDPVSGTTHTHHFTIIKGDNTGGGGSGSGEPGGGW